jgi:putative transposase
MWLLPVPGELLIEPSSQYIFGLKPSTLLNIPKALKNRKYRVLYSNKHNRKSGLKGPTKELIDAIVDTKQRNLTWGCPRIAQQIALALGISLDKDVVRRVWANH